MDRIEVFLGVGNIGDQRCTEGMLDAALFQPCGIGKDRFVIHARVLLVSLSVCQFDVHVDEIAEGDHLLEGVGICKARGFDGDVTLLFEQGQKLHAEVGLQKRFPAGQRDAAAHGVEKGLMTKQLFGKRFCLPLHPRRTDEVLRADMQTPPDLLAFGVVAGLSAKSATETTVLL